MSEPTNDDLAGPFIRWTNYGYEGWRPTSFATLEEALLVDRYNNEIVVTRVVVFDIVEREE